jgi:hypothetical protein
MNLTQNQLDAKQAYLNNNQSKWLALYEKQTQTKEKPLFGI